MKFFAGRCLSIALMVSSVMGLVLFDGAVYAIDVPVYYRASFFQGTPASSIDDWATYLSAAYGEGRAHHSWDHKGEKVSLFSGYGFFDLGKLGFGVENMQAKTKEYWEDGVGKFTNAPDLPFDFSGRATVKEFNITWRQNLFSGFFTELYVPFKNLKLDRIDLSYKGTFDQKDSMTATIDKAYIDAFIADDLPVILSENGIQSDFKAPFKQSGPSDAIFSFGWQGQTTKSLGIIKELRGQLQIGALLPTAVQKIPLGRLFSLPMGANGQMGFVWRAHAEAGFWKFLRLGFSGGAIMYLKQREEARVKTDRRQNGDMLLQFVSVRRDFGSKWDLCGYLQAHNLLGGFSALAGLSLSRQEATRLHISDANYLKTVIAKAAMGTPPEQRDGRFISKDEVANTDRRLKGWEQLTLHFLAEYDVKAYEPAAWAPKLSLGYDISVGGKHSYLADMLSGAIQFQFNFSF
jgi:hypothetical protein